MKKFLWTKFLKPVAHSVAAPTFLATLAMSAIGGRWKKMGTDIASRAVQAVFPNTVKQVGPDELVEQVNPKQISPEDAKMIAGIMTKEILFSDEFYERAMLSSAQIASVFRAYMMILQPEFADTEEEINELIAMM